MKRSYTKKQKKFLYALALVAIAICLVVELIGMIPGVSFNGWSDVGIALGLTPSPVTPEGELEVHFLDVGNADCILVRQGDQTMLIDAGEADDQERILKYLQQHGVQKLDLVIATHPHADHIGSMAAVIKQYPIGRFVMSFMRDEATPTTRVYTKMLEALDSCGVTVDEAVPGTEYALGTARVQLLAPFEAVDEANDVSVVCRLSFGNRAFVFTGAVKALGAGLRPTAFWDDRYVEAFEHETLPILGVQWHPEKMRAGINEAETAEGLLLFQYFVEMCKK